LESNWYYSCNCNGISYHGATILHSLGIRMNLKKIFSIRHNHVNAHHKYQMSVVLWFILYFVLFITYFVYTDKYNADINTYQWYFFIPLMTIYVTYHLKLRNKISPEKRVDPLRRPIMHWIILGISSLTLYLEAVNLETRPESLIIAFIIFTIFAADGYWDFKETTKLWKKNGKS
jgi:heme/copper-type cytochrome/quinol oxidase subunit 3